MANGQDWTDTLDARAAGMVLGFAESGAPLDTADVAPADRERLDVEVFAAVEPPPTSDPRDARIAELEAQLRTEQDRRIAELETAIADAQTAPAPPAPVAQLGETAPAATGATAAPASAYPPPPPAPAGPVPGDVPPASDAAATAEAQGTAATGTPADPGTAPQ